MVGRWSLVAWAAALGASSWIPGGAVLAAVYCGTDWEAPCEQHIVAGYWTAGVLVALPLIVAFVIAARWRVRWLIVAAISAAPLQWWFLTGYGLSVAAERPF